MNIPPKRDDEAVPKLDLAVLVLMPCSPVERRSSDDNDDFDDLPDMVVGMTTLKPMVERTAAAGSNESNGSIRDGPGEGEVREKSKDVAEVAHLEHQPDNKRRAQWRRHNHRWVVEGLDE